MKNYHITADVTIGFVDENTGKLLRREFKGMQVDWDFPSFVSDIKEIYDMEMWKHAGFSYESNESPIAVDNVDVISIVANAE